ncbi:MAG TPA: phosphatidylserine decarboxylase family protein [Bacteroidales bacterium]|nr:phosphatidylserine decarboxylase family protein [Bacteroidales bacterium]
MSIHKEGYKILLFGFITIIIVNIIAQFILPGNTLGKLIILFVTLILYVFLLFFFRLPRRYLQPDDQLVYSPADGKVVVIENTYEGEYFKEERMQVSIFMSPVNMHSNRYPVSGRIKYVKYHPGKYLVAWHPKSSELNERSTVVIETENNIEILVRQVAGAIARRIVTYSKEGEVVKQGDELGFIKLGSRVDLFLPGNSEIVIPILQQVRANKSVLARFPG